MRANSQVPALATALHKCCPRSAIAQSSMHLAKQEKYELAQATQAVCAVDFVSQVWRIASDSLTYAVFSTCNVASRMPNRNRPAL